MTNTTLPPATALDWVSRGSAGTNLRTRIAKIRQLLGEDIGQLLLPDVIVNERLSHFVQVSSPPIAGPDYLPALRYTDARMELYLAEGPDRHWQLIYLPLNRHVPALPPLERIAKHAGPRYRQDMSAKFPDELRSIRPLGVEPPNFWVCLSSEMWLCIFIHQLMYELAQSNA